MNNFEFKNPTKIIFGKNTIEKLEDEIPKDAKVLLLYGGGSIKKMVFTIKLRRLYHSLKSLSLVVYLLIQNMTL